MTGKPDTPQLDPIETPVDEARGGSSDARLWKLVLAMAVIGGPLVWTSVRYAAPHSGHRLSWWWLGLAMAAADAIVVSIPFRRGKQAFSLSEIPIVAGLFLVHPATLVVIRCLAPQFLFRVKDRLNAIQTAFNLAYFTWEISLFLLVLRLVAPGLPATHWRSAVAVMVASVVIGTIAPVLVALYMSAADGHWAFNQFPSALGFSILTHTGNSAMGLLLVHMLTLDRAWAWLLALPALLLVIAYRAINASSIRQRRLEFLHEATSDFHRALSLDRGVAAVLSRSRDFFHSEVAVLLLRIDEHHCRVISSSSHDPVEVGDSRLMRMNADQAGAFTEMLSRGTHVVDVTKGAQHERLFAIPVPLAHVLVSPLQGSDQAMAVLVVGRHRDDTQRFTSDDRLTLETLSRHLHALINTNQLERSLADVGKARDQLQQLAYVDALTNLANRSAFERALADEVAEHRDAPANAAVIFIDLDDFKVVNDTLGHEAGDQALRIAAKRLLSCVGSQDLLCRIGGDEFAVLVVEGVTDARLERLASSMTRALAEPLAIYGQVARVGSSIGIARTPHTRPVASELVRHADLAMYQAKRNGKGSFVFFEPELDIDRSVIATSSAMRPMEIPDHPGLLYQPIVDVRTGRTHSLEAMVRAPLRVRGDATRSTCALHTHGDQLTSASEQMLMAIASDLPRFADENRLGLPIGFKLNAIQLLDLSFGALLTDWVHRFNVPSLILTLTDTAKIPTSSSVATTVAHLRLAGLRIAVDHVGATCSSMELIRYIDVDMLKLDPALVTDLANDARARAVAQSIIDLGQALGVDVVAVGVESSDQVLVLSDLGVQLAQGTSIARAVAANELCTDLAGRPSRVDDQPTTTHGSTVHPAFASD